jgi:hypothetical protein
MRCRVFCPGERAPKLIYPLVRELADDDVDVAVACRVLNVSRSGYYAWLVGSLHHVTSLAYSLV